MEDFVIKHTPEYIFFLQHPEKNNYYLIIQDAQCSFDDLYAQFNRTGDYAPPNPATMPYNKVKLIERIPVPDRNLFGLCYFITHELEEITYEEDERYRYTEWGWYVVNGDLQINKWLKNYLQVQEAKLKNKPSQIPKSSQISLF
jgi:hypothetical protein